MKRTFLPLLTLCLLIAPFSAYGGDFDGSKALICAPVEIYGCGPSDGCVRETTQSTGLPSFLRINFKKKVITGTAEDGTLKTTKIKKMDSVDGRMLLQGVQKGRAWSMVILHETGKMTLTASGDDTAFVVFGPCTP